MRLDIKQAVYHEVGGTIYTVCADRDGRLFHPHATSTVIIKYPSGEDLVASQAVTFNAVNSTVSAAAGVDEDDPTQISISSTASIKRDQKLILTRALTQETEEIRVKGIDTVNSKIYTYEPLELAYASADTLFSPEVSVTLDATAAAERNVNYYAEFKYKEGVNDPWEFDKVVFDVVKTLFKVKFSLADFKQKYFPHRYKQGLAGYEGTDFKFQIARGIEEVARKIENMDNRPHLVWDGSQLANAVYCQALYFLQEIGVSANPRVTADTMFQELDRLQSAAATAFDLIRMWVYDKDDSGSITDGETGLSHAGIDLTH